MNETSIKKNSNPILLDWSLVPKATDTGVFFQVQGRVYNHPNPEIKDGEIATTSSLMYVEGSLFHTKNRVYEVTGSPDKDWEQWLISQDKTVQDILNNFQKGI